MLSCLINGNHLLMLISNQSGLILSCYVGKNGIFQDLNLELQQKIMTVSDKLWCEENH